MRQLAQTRGPVGGVVWQHHAVQRQKPQPRGLGGAAADLVAQARGVRHGAQGHVQQAERRAHQVALDLRIGGGGGAGAGEGKVEKMQRMMFTACGTGAGMRLADARLRVYRYIRRLGMHNALQLQVHNAGLEVWHEDEA